MEEDVNSAENFIEAVKLRIARKKSRKTRYMNLAWIPATTCEVERLSKRFILDASAGDCAE